MLLEADGSQSSHLFSEKDGGVWKGDTYVFQEMGTSSSPSRWNRGIFVRTDMKLDR